LGAVVGRKELSEILGRLKLEGKKVVFTNGCFDILHRGHVACLEQAKRFGDVLVVGLNSDESVRRLKGPGRPFLGQEDRAAVLSALCCVDYVCIFERDTPLDLIVELRPDVLVKGADYRESEVVGAKEVSSWGGEVRLVELVPGVSTSEIAKRIAASVPKNTG